MGQTDMAMDHKPLGGFVDMMNVNNRMMFCLLRALFEYMGFDMCLTSLTHFQIFFKATSSGEKHGGSSNSN